MRRSFAPVALAVAVACALGACKKDDAAADAGAAAAQQAPAPTPESVVSATVTAMSPEQLRDEASKAYGENRLYAPAGNNAMEYYLALRDKQPADAGASSALTDLLPMTVIATEQGIAREDFADAKRLAALIEKADAKHPALSRLKAAIASSETAAAARVESQKLTAEEEAKRQEELAKKREEDQRKLQEQQKQQAAAQAPAAATPAAQTAAAAEAERQREAAAEAERQRAAAAAAEQQRQQAAAQQPAAQPARAASSELRPISNPGPRYPQAAQRAGAGGSVQVEFTVNTDGSVGGVRAVSSDGPRQFQREFEREALAAVKRWRFQPVSEATTTRRTIAFQQ
ncbi:MAG: energy transducer TonB [Thermomonas sp.]|nr:energy transducer TonB [Thermomonas sp.]MBL0228433.1 energy transducer TonB [Thermomonas sp.]MBP7158862.1 energy transducer TonB [Thermomonas sp.]MBP7788814.1 energy transducer TonB [Thermomonas sp.]MBP8648451.1 energy transducer TonB [Thermomonas sp.]